MSEEKGFLDKLNVDVSNDGKTLLTKKPFRWRNGRLVTVPPLFVTDMASIPRVVPGLLTGLIAVLAYQHYGPITAVLLAGGLGAMLGLTPFGRHHRAAVIHDYLYYAHATEEDVTRRIPVTRAEADWAFFLAMKDCGVFLMKRWAMYAAVAICGRWAWKSERRRGAAVNRVLEAEPEHVPTMPAQGIEWALLKFMGRAA